MTDFDLLKKEIKKAFPGEHIPDKELASMTWELVDFLQWQQKPIKPAKRKNNCVFSN